MSIEASETQLSAYGRAFLPAPARTQVVATHLLLIKFWTFSIWLCGFANELYRDSWGIWAA